jgi:peptidoglycan/xylan/chitin deacetylase (PgdA/CDA1 family)
MMRRRDFLGALAAAPPVLRGARARARGAARAIAITVDDLPAARRSFPSELLEELSVFRSKNKKFLDRLRKHSTPFAGFVTEGWTPRAWPEDGLRTILDDWLDAGAELGNHTYSHPDLYTTPLDRYQADIVLGEAALGSALAERGKRMQFFRHPYLHTRKNHLDSKDLEAYLGRSGYRTAPVTVDTQDWIFAEIYAWALSRGDEPRQAEVKNGYLAYMTALFDHVEGASRETLGREPVQVLLIHASALNFDLIGELHDLIEGRGYDFVSLEEALEDEAYREEIPPLGSWIHGWRAVRNLEKRPDPAPAAFLGRLFEDYGLVKAAAPALAAPVTKRVGDR